MSALDRDYARRGKRSMIDDIDDDWQTGREAPQRPALTGKERMQMAALYVLSAFLVACAGIGMAVLVDRALARNDYPMPADYRIEPGTK